MSEVRLLRSHAVEKTDFFIVWGDLLVPRIEIRGWFTVAYIFTMPRSGSPGLKPGAFFICIPKGTIVTVSRENETAEHDHWYSRRGEYPFDSQITLAQGKVIRPYRSRRFIPRCNLLLPLYVPSSLAYPISSSNRCRSLFSQIRDFQSASPNSTLFLLTSYYFILPYLLLFPDLRCSEY
jgi:hypothetical protein